MKLAPTAALTLAAMSAMPAAMAYDSGIADIVERSRVGKLVRSIDIAEFMRQSERWCYESQDGSCAWTDIYFNVTGKSAEMEIANAWSPELDTYIVDKGTFEDGRYICETGADWLSTVRATRRSDGSMLTGRDLAEVKAQIADNIAGSTIDCFDYLFVSADAEQDLITLTQRQYTDNVYQEGMDVEVVLHFDADAAAALTLRAE